MYYNYITLMFFNGLMVQNNIKEGFFSEETKFRSVVEKHLESYWRIRISIISHETRGMSTTLKELKENFDINLNNSGVNKTNSKYKWGYKLELNDLKFIANSKFRKFVLRKCWL